MRCEVDLTSGALGPRRFSCLNGRLSAVALVGVDTRSAYDKLWLRSTAGEAKDCRRVDSRSDEGSECGP